MSGRFVRFEQGKLNLFREQLRLTRSRNGGSEHTTQESTSFSAHMVIPIFGALPLAEQQLILQVTTLLLNAQLIFLGQVLQQSCWYTPRA